MVIANENNIKKLRTIDASSIYSILSKLLNSINNFVSIILVGIFLSSEQQGFFFTLLSFSVLFVFIELGLNFAIIQFAGHEMAAFRTAKDEDARKAAESRLISLGRIAFLWFWLGAIVFLLGAGGGGSAFFHSVPGGEAAIAPWMLLCSVVAADFALMPFWSLLEGVNEVYSVYRYRTLRMLAMGFTTWAALALGADLWALGIGYLATFPLSAWMIFKTHRAFFLQFRAQPNGPVISWKNELLPFQWRLALSWMCGYFATWAITPLTMKMFDPSTAGQIGMVWSLSTGVTTIATAMITVKAPQFGMLVVQRQFSALDHAALRVGGISIVMALLFCLVILAGVWGLNTLGHPYAQRLLPLGPTALILAATVLLQVLQPMAIYLRAHKREPFLPVSIVFALSSLAAILTFGHLYGPQGIAYGYMLVVGVITLPLATFIFLRCRRQWHR